VPVGKTDFIGAPR